MAQRKREQPTQPAVQQPAFALQVGRKYYGKSGGLVVFTKDARTWPRKELALNEGQRIFEDPGAMKFRVVPVAEEPPEGQDGEDTDAAAKGKEEIEAPE